MLPEALSHGESAKSRSAHYDLPEHLCTLVSMVKVSGGTIQL